MILSSFSILLCLEKILKNELIKRIGGALSFKKHYRMCEAIGVLLMDRKQKYLYKLPILEFKSELPANLYNGQISDS